FKKIIDEAKYFAPVLWLHVFGEPLMNPEIFRMIKYCKERGIRNVGLSTNITLLDREKSAKLLDSGLDIIVLSLDGATRETYAAIRRGGDFEKAENNVKTFLEMKEKKGSKIHVILSIIRMKETQKEIAAFKKRWNSPMIDEIWVKEFITWGGQLDLSDIAPQNRNSQSMKQRYPCRKFWESVVISSNGKVLPCCYDYDEKLILGDITKQTLSEIWNGEILQEIRKAQCNGNFDNPLCKNCQEWSGFPKDDKFIISVVKRGFLRVLHLQAPSERI
ncbi:MAG: radical SAM/SPASM domain-containing protein, partial [Candidatus Hadarchaeales archaeon]